MGWSIVDYYYYYHLLPYYLTMYPDPWVLGASLVLWRASCRLLDPPVGACYIIPWVHVVGLVVGFVMMHPSRCEKNKTVAQMKVSRLQNSGLLVVGR